MLRRALLLVTTGAALAAAAPAAAGTYEVLACGAAGGVNNSWTPEVSTAAITASNACASGGAFPADDIFIQFGGSLGVYTTLGAAAPPVGAYGYWRLEVPDPLRIVATRGTGHGHSESDSWRLQSAADYGELGHCQTNEPGSGVTDHCDVGGASYGSPLPVQSTAYPQPARWVRVGFVCTIAPCDTGVSTHAAGQAIFSAAETVSDLVAPSASLAGVAAQVSTAAPVEATVSGSDQTGIARLELLVDGQVVASSVRACDFTRVLPCEAPGGQVSVKLSSGALSPGLHQVAARAFDAAGNTATSGVQPVQASAPQGQPVPSTPVPSTPTPPDPPVPGTTPAPPATGVQALKLRIASVSRSKSKVRVRGRAAAGCRSRLTVKVTAAGRTRTARVTVGRTGRWGTSVSGVRRGAKLRVKVSAKAAGHCGADSASTTRR